MVNVISAIGSILLGSFFLLSRARLARDQAQSVERGEISKEDAEKKVELVKNCGLFLTGGGAIWLAFQLLGIL